MYKHVTSSANILFCIYHICSNMRRGNCVSMLPAEAVGVDEGGDLKKVCYLCVYPYQLMKGLDVQHKYITHIYIIIICAVSPSIITPGRCTRFEYGCMYLVISWRGLKTLRVLRGQLCAAYAHVCLVRGLRDLCSFLLWHRSERPHYPRSPTSSLLVLQE